MWELSYLQILWLVVSTDSSLTGLWLRSSAVSTDSYCGYPQSFCFIQIGKSSIASKRKESQCRDVIVIPNTWFHTWVYVKKMFMTDILFSMNLDIYLFKDNVSPSLYHDHLVVSLLLCFGTSHEGCHVQVSCLPNQLNCKLFEGGYSL